MSDDTKALVERLRESLTARDAADAIERLERELAETRVDRDLHYSRCASLIFSEPFSKVTSAEIQKWHREYVADRDALAECCEKLREALNQIAVLAEWQTSGPDTSPRCKSDALSAGHATSLRGSISEIARAALAATKDAP